MINSKQSMPGLYAWQSRAIAAWQKNSCRGIIAAATGSGKTRVALEAIKGHRDGVSVIIVPTIALQEQWVTALSRMLKVNPKQVGTLGGRNPQLRIDDPIVVAVLASARGKLSQLAEVWHSQSKEVLLILDECHWAGTRAVETDLRTSNYDKTLGLSATPEREDGGLDEVLVPALGPVVFRYPLVEALDDGLLAPLRVFNLTVPLAEIELKEYLRLTAEINSESQRAIPNLRKLERLEFARQRVTTDASGRRLVLRELFSSGVLNSRKAILFHETIKSAERTFEDLKALKISAIIEHSGLSSAARAAALKRFAAGRTTPLVTVRALDEGIDVPSADTAIVVSGRMNARQRLQRAGRVVRPSESVAWFISLLALGTHEEFAASARDPELFGSSRVTYLDRPSALISTLASA